MTSRPKATVQPSSGKPGMPKSFSRRRPFRYGRQNGVFSIMFAVLIVVLLAFCGLAIDTGPMYNRKADLNAMAEAVALAAAKELNGTAAGIDAAKASAMATAERLTYKNGVSFTWNDAALSFSATPARSGNWISASGTVANPDALYYAKVDTSLLSAATGEVNPVFMPVLSSSLGSVQISDSAVAGKTTVNVTPIAVCAMSPNAAAQRTNTGITTSTELVQYGFRRGVSYDLMQLNPDGLTPVRFLINPLQAPGGSSAFDTSIVGQFVCTGTMWVPRLTGGSLRVSPLPTTAPLAALSQQLNSRFDDYTGGLCSPNGAPPDFNIKQYAYNITNGAPWMSPATGSAAVRSTTTRGKLETIADLPTPPVGTNAGDYGPVWAFAKAAKYAASEPRTGYTTYSTTDWVNLYRSGPSASGYPSASSTPYSASSGSNYAAPAASRLEISTEQRRVLNIPLLSCPVSSASLDATVLAVGRFFMTVPATNDRLIAEFAGLVPAQSLSGLVELYP